MAGTHTFGHGFVHDDISDDGTSDPTSTTTTTGPHIVMVPNPDFSFPMRPAAAPSTLSRPNSSHDAVFRTTDRLSATGAAPPHRRAASTLPTFSFNAQDTSGRRDDVAAAAESDQVFRQSQPSTPSRRGHRRGASEFVGGDSRLGVDNALSTSPTKPTTTMMPEPGVLAGAPPGRRGHAHRRSTAMSSHDVTAIMIPPDLQPRQSNSLPSTPLESVPVPRLRRGYSASDAEPSLPDPFGPPLGDPTEDRPPSSSRRVGFSDNVTIIPRPLSTISSETESSISTMRGHSVNNSISSVLSLSTPSPPSARAMRRPLGIALEDNRRNKRRQSQEISKRVEKEGEWLKSRSSSSLRRPLSESSVPRPFSQPPETPVRSQVSHKSKQSLSYGLSFERRQSEPSISLQAAQASRLSALSLQDTFSAESQPDAAGLARSGERLSSTRKIKAWAASVISRKPKDAHKENVDVNEARACNTAGSAESDTVPGKVAFTERPVAETNLDAALGSDGALSEVQWSRLPAPSQVEGTTNPRRQTHLDDSDDNTIMVDLDAALGPLQTPPLGSGAKTRRELHSNRSARDFGGPRGHYHRRTESAPVLSPLETNMGAVQQSSMADVFEEDEEDDNDNNDNNDNTKKKTTGRTTAAIVADKDEEQLGIAIVDSDLPEATDASHTWATDSGLGISPTASSTPRPFATRDGVTSEPPVTGARPRGASIVEEGGSPVENVEIVQSHEEPRTSSLEPRAPSLTKSSESSEAPTVTGNHHNGTVASLDGSKCLTTPDTYQTSTFSSPDLARNQYSFEASRLGTSASSVTDNRTLSSNATGEHPHENRISVDDVPSLTSSHSTALSGMPVDGSRREGGVAHRIPSASSARTVEAPASIAESRRKRSSIQSLSQLVGSSLGSKTKLVDGPRPKTSVEPRQFRAAKKEHRLKKLMFWRSKQNSGEQPPPNLN